MKKIPKPTIRVSEVLVDCIDNYREPLKQELFNSLSIIEDAETDFEAKKQVNQLYLIPQNEVVSDEINKDVLNKVYTDKMASRQNPKGRNHYESIILSAPQGICPLCSQRDVKTLDHYLPKAKYPLFSITPINLIPACTDCNTGKHAESPRNSEEETLHPYYDDVESFSWLKMQIIQINPIKVKFYTAPPQNIPNLLRKRISFHFDNFSLNNLYVSHAMQEYANNELHFRRLHERGGNRLKYHLQDSFESRREININSWQTAFYECLVNNEDFCNGLFL